MNPWLYRSLPWLVILTLFAIWEASSWVKGSLLYW